jgi:enoyl-CoA hydratase/carnithine racemase
VSYDGYKLVRIEVNEGIATVLIDYPPLNLFDLALRAEIMRVGEELTTDHNVRVVILRSAVPGFFIAHAEASMILQARKSREEVTPHDWANMCEIYRTMPKATIAVIEGRAGGGGSELALSCDMRFAARETAIFNQWEVAFGSLAGSGGVSRLARLMGRSRALEVLLGCDDFSADVAELYGWVNRTLPTAELNGFVERLARRIASFPPHAVAATKDAVLQRVDKEGRADILADSEDARRNRTPVIVEALEKFLEAGGQTIEGESRFGELLFEINAHP